MCHKQNFIDQMKEQGLILPYSEDLSSYQMPLTLYGKKIPNRIGIQPLEGFDSDLGGGPTDMVRRRYLRFVKSGAGLIWFEACAVSEDGKSNPNQMALTDDNVNAFKELLQLMDQTAREANREPAFKVIQLTHSGRVSRDQNWNSMPLAARKNQNEESCADDEISYLPNTESITDVEIPCLSNAKSITDVEIPSLSNAKSITDNEIPYPASDERIRQMVAEHIHAAELAAEAGFDAVDIKVCHGYFLSEMLSAFHRPGPYGGSFENRTRALFEIVDGIKAATGDKIGITLKLNAYDSVPAPYGYGIVQDGDRLKADLNETIQICRMLRDRGVQLINISASSPEQHLFGPDPTDKLYQKYVSSTDLLTAAKLLKENVPEVAFMCAGLSAFRDFGAGIGAGGISEGWFDIAGFGRQALAYPDFANDLLNNVGLDEKKCCIGCNNCFKLMDPGHTMAGCIVRDRDMYFPLYQKYVLKK